MSILHNINLKCFFIYVYLPTLLTGRSTFDPFDTHRTFQRQVLH